MSRLESAIWFGISAGAAGTAVGIATTPGLGFGVWVAVFAFGFGIRAALTTPGGHR